MRRTGGVEAAFDAAGYRVWIGERAVDVAIGARCPGRLADWMAGHGRRVGWIVTACNPGARRKPAAFNRARHRRLQRWAAEHRANILASRATDPGGVWPDESGLLVAGPGRTRVRLLAARLGQLAIVEVNRSAPTRLIWTRAAVNAARSDRDRDPGTADRGSPA